LRIEWWKFVGILVDKYHMSIKDAWNCTLADYMTIVMSSKGAPVSDVCDKSTQKDILEFFAWREVVDG
jgi:hypothetical protein